MCRTAARIAFVALGSLTAATAGSTTQSAADPFAFFRPDVTLSADDRRAVDRGEARVQTLAHREHDVAVFGLASIRIDGDRLVAWVRDIARMKEGPALLAAGRFSDPPRVEDVARLSLDAEDLRAIQQCRPRGCDLKLSADEIATLQREITGPAPDWRPRMQQAFRQMVVDRVRAFQARGLAGVPPFQDRDPPRLTKDAFAVLFDQSKSLKAGLPEVAAALQGPPEMPPGVESFYYWAKERFSGKPVISATHVSIVRPAGPNAPAAVIIGKQLFATHYFDSSLSVTALLKGSPGGHNYVAYLNRSELDVVGGVFGGVARVLIQRRIRSEAGELLEALRKRLERGDPPK